MSALSQDLQERLNRCLHSNAMMTNIDRLRANLPKYKSRFDTKKKAKEKYLEDMFYLQRMAFDASLDDNTRKYAELAHRDFLKYSNVGYIIEYRWHQISPAVAAQSNLTEWSTFGYGKWIFISSQNAYKFLDDSYSIDLPDFVIFDNNSGELNHKTWYYTKVNPEGVLSLSNKEIEQFNLKSIYDKVMSGI